MNRYLCFTLGAVTGGLATLAVMFRQERKIHTERTINIFVDGTEPTDGSDFEDEEPENADITQPTMEDVSCTDS